MPEQHNLAMQFTQFFHDLGQWMLIDDIWDIGKFSFEGHPSPFHHWQLGWVLKELALYVGQGLTFANAWQKAGEEMTKSLAHPLHAFNRMVEEQKQEFDRFMKELPV